MAESTDMILPMPREMRAETTEGFERVDRRLAAIETAHNSFRHTLPAESLLSTLVAGEFERRNGLLARKVAALEAIK